ncbi:Putative SERF-like protein, partial [Auxenochlorella protothecoides]
QTRGNQRDIDRARAQKRKEQLAKGNRDDNLTPLQRKERDAKALAEKLAKKAAADAKK